MQLFTKIFLSLVASLVLLGVANTVLAEPAQAATPSLATFSQACSPGGGALPSVIFVPWYQYLPCGPNGPSFEGISVAQGVAAVAIAVIETLTRLAGLIAVGFVIYGGILYITSQGDPNGINNAKSTIANALIGLVIALLAIVIAQVVGGVIGGGQGGGILPRVDVLTSLPTATRFVFGVVGVLSVIFVAVGGLQYTVSGGDPQGITRAKDTILYALIGLAVAVSAFIIVGFVTGRIL